MTTILLDGDIYIHRAVAVATTSVTFGEESSLVMNQKHAEVWFKSEVAKLRKRLGAKAVLIALGDRTANFRKELCPTYKAHRATFKPAGFLEFEATVVKNCKTVREPRLEGDDILGLLATSPKIKDGIVVSIDKDMRQVPGKLYNPDHEQLIDVDEEGAELVHLHQTLTGDRVDGYPGLPGCGPVKAAKILAGDLDTAWERVLEAFEKKGLTEVDALLQARLARILRYGDYNRETKEVTLWTPM